MTAERDAAWHAYREYESLPGADRHSFDAGWNAAAERANGARRLERQPATIDRSALAKLLDERIPDGALDYEQLDGLTRAIVALAQPVDGVTITREQAQYLRRLIWTQGDSWDEEEQALAEQLEAAS